MKNKITPEEFIGKVVYDHVLEAITGNNFPLLELTTWSRASELFKNVDLIVHRNAVEDFHYELGQFIADAINEKIERSKLK